MTEPLDPNLSDASFLRRFWNNVTERVARMTVENTIGIEVPAAAPAETPVVAANVTQPVNPLMAALANLAQARNDLGQRLSFFSGDLPDDVQQGGAPMASRVQPQPSAAGIARINGLNPTGMAGNVMHAPNLGIVPTAVLPDLNRPTFEELTTLLLNSSPVTVAETAIERRLQQEAQRAFGVDEIDEATRRDLMTNGWAEGPLHSVSNSVSVTGGTITGLPLASTPLPVHVTEQPMQHIRLNDGNYYYGPALRDADNEIGMDGRTWLQRERDVAEARAQQIEEQAAAARLRLIDDMWAEQQAANVEMDEAMRAFASTLPGVTPRQCQLVNESVSVKYANNKLTIEISHEGLAHASVMGRDTAPIELIYTKEFVAGLTLALQPCSGGNPLVLSLLRAAVQQPTVAATPVATLPNTERGIQLPRKRR